MHFFFSQFNHKLFDYSRGLLDYSLSTAVGIFLFVFGNMDYFPESHNNEIKLVIFGETTSENVFEPKGEGAVPPSRIPNLHRMMIRRISESFISNVIIMMAIGYGIYLLITLLIAVFRRMLKINLIEAGIEVFAQKKKYPEIQFEDLVSKTEIICQSYLNYHSRGREAGGPKVWRMHKERLNRFRRNFKRKKMKADRMRRRRQPIFNMGGPIEDVFRDKVEETLQEKDQQHFETTSSYDFRVKYKSVDFMQNNFFHFSSCFTRIFSSLNVTSNPQKMHPSFRQIFVKRLMTKIIHKASYEDVKEKAVRQRVLRGGLFDGLISQSSKNIKVNQRRKVINQPQADLPLKSVFSEPPKLQAESSLDIGSENSSFAQNSLSLKINDPISAPTQPKKSLF